MTLYERTVERASRVGGHPPLLVNWFTTSVRVHLEAGPIRRYLDGQHHVVASPALQPSMSRAIELYAVADPRLLDAVKGSAKSPTVHMRESFKGVWYTCWEGAGGEVVMLIAQQHKFQHALLTRDFQSWAIVGDRPDGLGFEITRTIREFVREDLLAQGALMFHGSAAESAQGGGVFLAGASAAGKTSAAIRLAQGGGYVVGTDRTFLLKQEGRWLAVGLPVSTRLGFGSANAFGLAPARQVVREQKASLSNAEVHDLLGCGFVAATTADSLIVLESTPDVSPQIDRLSAADAGAALREHLLAPDPDYRSRWLTADPAPESAAHALSRLSSLVEEQPVLRVGWDPTVHCNEGAVQLLSMGGATR